MVNAEHVPYGLWSINMTEHIVQTDHISHIHCWQRWTLTIMSIVVNVTHVKPIICMWSTLTKLNTIHNNCGQDLTCIKWLLLTRLNTYMFIVETEHITCSVVIVGETEILYGHCWRHWAFISSWRTRLNNYKLIETEHITRSV